ncbi:MAG: (Fe-S)-binding protein [Propionibacteriaceae bacterium]|jgi:L-lactate dehydrogenase complex protein LldE|nr:(Fe-S)-binding protein [Propionibacteriaceae bacterium]
MSQPGQGLSVGLFATCINDVMFPDTPKHVAELLTRLGCSLTSSPAQTCCGQMFTNTGYFREGEATVEAYVEAFADCDYVVAPSASCIGSVRHQHQMLAAHRPALARKVDRLIKRSLDLTEFLTDILEVEDVGASFPHTVTYHTGCHSLRVARIGDRPQRLLRAVRGLRLVDLADSDICCGFGGTFCLKNPDVSIAMATNKAKAVADTKAEYLAAVDNACLMNIGGILHRIKAPVTPIHVASILVQQEP